MKIIYGLLFLMPFLFESSISKCVCGTDKPIGSDFNLVDAVNNAEGVDKIFDKLGTQSKQMCVGYTIDNGIIPIPKFKKNQIKKAKVTNTCKTPNSDGSFDCIIEDPNFSTPDLCYPAQHFCVHQVKCPNNYRATLQCSGLDLPKSESDCLDALRITSGRLFDKEVCGTTQNCFPEFTEAGGSLITVTFTSGLCCQNCGYRLWVRCVPQPTSRKREINTQNDIHQIEERGVRGPPRKITYTVQIGREVTFSNGRVRVMSGNKTVWMRKATWLYVKDNVAFGVGNYFKARYSTKRKFPGYGKVTAYYRSNRVYYEQQGVPSQEKPNAAERKFIKQARSHLRRFLKSNINSGSSTPSKWAVKGKISYKFKRSLTTRPSCQAIGETVRSTPNTNSCGAPGLPGPPSPTFIAKARRYSKSKKPIVSSIAKLFLKYLAPSKPPIGRLGLKGPPGPA